MTENSSQRTGTEVSFAATTAGSDDIDALANDFVARLLAIRPVLATEVGRPGGQDRLDDLSPDGLAAVHELTRQTETALTGAVPTSRAQGVARQTMLERLRLELDRYDTGWAHADLNVLASPLQMVRMVFDLMPTGTPEERSVFAARMHAVPGALSGYAQSLRSAASAGLVAAARQVDKCAEQCSAYAGANGTGFFTAAVRALEPGSAPSPELLNAAAAAEAGYGELARFLTEELRPLAPTKDAVGRDRYVLASREFLGATVDLEETYDWGWQEFLSIEAEMFEVANRIVPGGTLKQAAEALDADQAHVLDGQDALRNWMQQLSDRALKELGSTHFDIPGPMRRLECLIAPPGGALGAYYTSPSDDFSRPGRMWWSVPADRTRFNTWRETSTVYHEGVPGHHLQLATAVLAKERLNDFQRLLATTSGHAEGWALYAERLVREVGYLADDGDLLGMLDAQLFRAARVVLDIGMHLELSIPAGTGFHEGETWTPELGLEFLLARTLNDAENSSDEINRYLGWPGQAPAYKVGERIWIDGRNAARARHGASFDQKAFHSAALNLGNMGLDQLASELARL